MAEPLLRRTFSRLRGRDRAKKADGKERDHPAPSPDPLPDPEAASMDPVPAASRRQNWARFSCGGRDEKEPLPAKASQDAVEPTEPDPASGIEHPKEEDLEPEEAEALNGELGIPGRNPGHGAYLQSLERSSRHWVLSSVKIPGVEEPGAGAELDPGSEGDIWYNPIPEDEGPQPGSAGKDTAEPIMDASGMGESSGAHSTEEPARTQPGGNAPVPPSPPGSPSKKVKSPGTVRRLSLRMRKLPELRRKLSLRNSRSSRGSPCERKESTNVISRYHLDTSVAAPRAKPSARAASLSDGDSPELPPKPRPHCDPRVGLDVGAFHPYSSGEMPPRCGQPLCGLVSVHLRGLEGLRLPPGDGHQVFCVLQVDAARRARTALLWCRMGALALNHTFNLELEGAQHLKVLVFSWDAASCRNRLCCHGTVVLPHIFRGCRAQQLAVRLQPRGVLYSKFTLVEQWERPSAQEPRVFGVELGKLVEREKEATKVPLIIQKCVAEIEKRGLKVVGLYRLCGSAAVKKELRDAFERDSAAVTLSEHLYPDINVITGILKDYLRELPTPLITPALHRTVLEAMAKRAPRPAPGEQDAVTLLECLPDVEKATLTRLLDHLSLVASHHDLNRMTAQNLAVCFGPVLLTPSRGTAGSSHSQDVASAVDFKRHIEVLHYLLQAWPAPPPSSAAAPGTAGAHGRGPAAAPRPREPPQ
ncbi:rho GTPase-activating protein SYDE1 [Melopsittacus undulatus]|uniref:rho GTPase-activating protein SYDE1 n=1 Tax=Melopsittacus undulatus TaxID=13146 RepID=UPI00146A4E5E|nr:rho GTPase-activating protein SYDE1 [Melopsittacus undulatus]